MDFLISQYAIPEKDIAKLKEMAEDSGVAIGSLLKLILTEMMQQNVRVEKEKVCRLP